MRRGRYIGPLVAVALGAWLLWGGRLGGALAGYRAWIAVLVWALIWSAVAWIIAVWMKERNRK